MMRGIICMEEQRFECEKVGLDFFEKATTRFSYDVEVPCSPEALFKSFEDAGSWPIWVGPISHVKWTSPEPFGVGSTRSVSLPGGMIGYEEFIAWEPCKHMAFRFNQFTNDSISAFGENYLVTDLGNGRCNLNWTIAMKQKGIAKMFAPLMRPVMRWYFGRMIGAISCYMEREGAKYSQVKLEGSRA